MKGTWTPESRRCTSPHRASFFTPGVKKLAEKYINMPRFRGKVWANTYVQHPPIFGTKYQHVSVDFWDWAGRGHTINDKLQQLLESVIINDPDPPNILWIWSNGRIRRPPGPWKETNYQEDGSDPNHFRHIHVTFDWSA